MDVASVSCLHCLRRYCRPLKSSVVVREGPVALQSCVKTTRTMLRWADRERRGQRRLTLEPSSHVGRYVLESAMTLMSSCASPGPRVA